MIAQIHLALCLVAWFTTLSLENACWHTPIDKRFWCFLAVQVGRDCSPVHSHSIRLELSTQSLHQDDEALGIQVLIYLDRLVQASDHL